MLFQAVSASTSCSNTFIKMSSDSFEKTYFPKIIHVQSILDYKLLLITLNTAAYTIMWLISDFF